MVAYLEKYSRPDKRASLGRTAHRWPRAKNTSLGASRRPSRYSEAGDLTGAIASMISDLRKSEEPVYDAMELKAFLVDALFFRNTKDEVRDLINSFN